MADKKACVLEDEHPFRYRDIQIHGRERKLRFNFTHGLLSGLLVSGIVLLLYIHYPALIKSDSCQDDTCRTLKGNDAFSVRKIQSDQLFTNLGIKILSEYVASVSAEKPVQQNDAGTNSDAALSCNAVESNRFDCWPETVGVSEQACQARGCCWKVAAQGIPACFYPDGYVSYSVSSMSSLAPKVGVTATLSRKAKSPYPDDVLQLQADIEYETSSRLRIKLYDPKNQRYEVPITLHKNGSRPTDTLFNVTIQSNPFGILVARKSNGAILFDSRNMAPLVFANQFLQIGTKLSSANIYGLGEHRVPLKLDTNWNKLILWNRDQPPSGGGNLYGSHPFYLNLEADDQAHGVVLLNSNAIEVTLQPYDNGHGSVTFIALGGILDFYVFAGPSTVDVVQQYVTLIGTPTMPPFWALGFHLCKYGYGTSAVMKQVIERNRAAGIPYDVQWNDIDSMRSHLDWTFDANGNFRDLRSIVDDLHSHDQRYIMIIDPGISSTQPAGTYPPWDQGLKMDVFIKNATGQVLIGRVWPGDTAYPDFFHPQAEQYWFNSMKDYHDKIPFNGIWIDMNEISNFMYGSTNGCPGSALDNPPFVPPTLIGGKLADKTVCPSAKQYISSHYNLHNLYGWSETKVTDAGLRKLLGKRSLVVSRSSFISSGHYGSHWLGDNISEWSAMYDSIPGILVFNMFGISMVGADICGFGGNANKELCIRWMQLGAFNPFMRNHADSGASPQDPASFDAEAIGYMRTALETRYRLLPYMYTCFYLSHTTGAPVVRPLFALFKNTESIDRQFMWGTELLVSPVLTQGATSVNAYIPEGIWYDVNNGSQLNAPSRQTVQLHAPLSTINVHIRGGSIIPTLPPAVTTNALRKGLFRLLVAPDANRAATGQLFWDDGESLDTAEKGQFTLVKFTLSGSTLSSQVLNKNAPINNLDTVGIFGVPQAPAQVHLDGKSVQFTYQANSKVLRVTPLSVNLQIPFTLNWM